MISWFLLVVFLGKSIAAPVPGFDFDPWLDDHAPILTAPIIKTVAPAPIWAPAPTILKTAPVIKTIAPATSYSSVTQYQLEHAPIITKTLIASPPLLKTYAPWKW